MRSHSDGRGLRCRTAERLEPAGPCRRPAHQRRRRYRPGPLRREHRRIPPSAGSTPSGTRNEIAAFESAWRRRIPTLAICRGAQLVNATRGGTLYVDLARDHPSDIPHRRTEEELLSFAHRVDVAAGSRLATWLNQDGELSVNSQHHQGIRRLAPGFTATAWASDGLIEAYEALDQPFTAIQWHPEINWSGSEMSQRLLRGFVDSCRSAVSSPAPLVSSLNA